MDAKLLAVTEWMKGTDLAEIAYRKDGAGFSLTAAGAGDPARIDAPALPSGRFTPVAAETVGVFQWSEPGKARAADEGSVVAEGDVLGVIVTGSGKAVPVKAAQAGRVSKLFVDAGQAVEYGQPLMLLEAR